MSHDDEDDERSDDIDSPLSKNESIDAPESNNRDRNGNTRTSDVTPTEAYIHAQIDEFHRRGAIALRLRDECKRALNDPEVFQSYKLKYLLEPYFDAQVGVTMREEERNGRYDEHSLARNLHNSAISMFDELEDLFRNVIGNLSNNISRRDSNFNHTIKPVSLKIKECPNHESVSMAVMEFEDCRKLIPKKPSPPSVEVAVNSIWISENNDKGWFCPHMTALSKALVVKQMLSKAEHCKAIYDDEQEERNKNDQKHKNQISRLETQISVMKEDMSERQKMARRKTLLMCAGIIIGPLLTHFYPTILEFFFPVV